uniref:helix-turn-helix transcriptional regulator n=4 Tax=Eubacteriales TaxID=186802 RepID=UPI003A903F49
KVGVIMSLTMGEKIKVILNRRNMTIAQLAALTGQSRQNMSNKMSRDNFSEKELREIAEALNCSFSAEFIMNDTNERI